jgi:dimethylargininase
VRSPGRSFASALTTQNPEAPIDVDLAQRQHRAYVQTLRNLGLKVRELAPDERFPDGCFVQDLAVVYRNLAVICRPGAPSRQGEEEAAERLLREYKEVVSIEEPGTVDGGDVLRVGDRFFVGLSGRTNRAGASQLRQQLEARGASVLMVPLDQGLHLMSGCTYLGNGLLLATGPWASIPQFLALEVIYVPHEEAYGANCLAIGDQVLVPDCCPRVSSDLQLRGFTVWPVAMSEFEKADGGVTCLSLLW